MGSLVGEVEELVPAFSDEETDDEGGPGPDHRPHDDIAGEMGEHIYPAERDECRKDIDESSNALVRQVKDGGRSEGGYRVSGWERITPGHTQVRQVDVHPRPGPGGYTLQYAQQDVVGQEDHRQEDDAGLTAFLRDAQEHTYRYPETGTDVRVDDVGEGVEDGGAEIIVDPYRDIKVHLVPETRLYEGHERDVAYSQQDEYLHRKDVVPFAKLLQTEEIRDDLPQIDTSQRFSVRIMLYTAQTVYKYGAFGQTYVRDRSRHCRGGGRGMYLFLASR